MKTVFEQYIDVPTATAMLGASDRHIRRQCSDGKLIGAKYEKGQWLIPLSAHPRLATAASLGHEDRSALGGVTAAKREAAITRLGLIKACEEFAADFVRSGAGTRKAAIECYCSREHVASRTMYRWMEDYRREGLIGLVDSRGGALEASEFSQEAQDYFKALWLDERRRSVKVCYDELVYLNKSSERNWQIPSLRSLHNWIARAIPLNQQILCRQGKAAYAARCAPFIEIDPDSIQPGEWWTGDHHQFNCFVRSGNEWVRPWVTAWMDIRSRAIVGYHISKSPNQSTILQAMRRGIEEYGPPEKVKIDNGRDYDSQMFTGQTKAARKALKKGYLDENLLQGIYAMMGIGVSFAIPYNPQAKSIERLFDTVDQQFCKSFSTYCGKDSDRKPEDLGDYLKRQSAIDEAYTLDTFAEAFGKWAAAYNNTVHTGRGMEGRSPAEVINTRTSRRVIDEGILDMLLCVWSGELKVGKNGVRFNGHNYGQFEPVLLTHFGRTVRLAYNPDDIRQVSVYDAATSQLLCVAEQNRLAKYGDAVSEEFTREAMRKKSAVARALKQHRELRHLDGLNITDLTIAAKNDAARPAPKDQTQLLRPVITPLDGQSAAYQAINKKRQLKKAAGAESMTADILGESIERSRPVKRGIL